MQSITKCITTETGHRLTAYDGKCAHFHGHSYKWEVTVSGDNTDNGMVMDFKELKGILNETVEELDHAFVLHIRDPVLKYMSTEQVWELFEGSDGTQGRLHIVKFNPTVENLVVWTGKKIKKMLPTNVKLAKIKCWETADSYCEISGDYL